MKLKNKRTILLKSLKLLQPVLEQWKNRSSSVKSRSRRKSGGSRPLKKNLRRKKQGLLLSVHSWKPPENEKGSSSYNWRASAMRTLQTTRTLKKSRLRRLHQRAVKFSPETRARRRRNAQCHQMRLKLQSAQPPFPCHPRPQRQPHLRHQLLDYHLHTAQIARTRFSKR